ncbi:hypothetical protein VVR12_01720 [Rothia sp. LK2588]|uniref:hypothetical protein n=1 Tax=Rothia sp. LK2588 TaxID=3114369 RepID=UPI0034D0045D
MTKYTSTTTVEAIRVEPGSADPYIEWLESRGCSASFTMNEIHFSTVDNYLYIADLGDYIIHHGGAEFSVMTSELFEETYTAEETTDWHGLTAAIKAGEPIDWEALDGRKAKCVHETMGELVYELERFKAHSTPTYAAAWCSARSSRVWWDALSRAWKGREGWTLYIDGPIPLKRKTADQLPLGMCFRGVVKDPIEGEDADYPRCQVLAQDNAETRVIAYRKDLWPMSMFTEPSQLEVIKEYGIGTVKAGDDE